MTYKGEDRRSGVTIDNSTVENMVDKIDSMHKILTGNGDPEKGLVIKVDRNSEFIKGFKKKRYQMIAVWIAICTTLITSVATLAAVIWGN